MLISILYLINCQIPESKELVRNFEEDTNTLIDPEKQLKKEEREKEWDLER